MALYRSIIEDGADIDFTHPNHIQWDHYESSASSVTYSISQKPKYGIFILDRIARTNVQEIRSFNEVLFIDFENELCTTYYNLALTNENYNNRVSIGSNNNVTITTGTQEQRINTCGMFWY